MNGEHYVSFGGEGRSWEEAVKYGFISAGGGTWFTNTLKLLKPGDRIWVKIPRTGYVGVGRVTGFSTPQTEFCVNVDGKQVPASDVLASSQPPDDPRRWSTLSRSNGPRPCQKATPSTNRVCSATATLLRAQGPGMADYHRSAAGRVSKV
jgi:hypothetical protein